MGKLDFPKESVSIKIKHLTPSNQSANSTKTLERLMDRQKDTQKDRRVPFHSALVLFSFNKVAFNGKNVRLSSSPPLQTFLLFLKKRLRKVTNIHGDLENKVFVKSTTLWRQESWKSIFPY